MNEDEQSGKLMAKIKANPSVPIGLAGLVGIVTYGLYNFKNKKMSPSLYLINLRVIAQGTVIGSMTIGIIYTLCRDHLFKLLPTSEKKV